MPTFELGVAVAVRPCEGSPAHHGVQLSHQSQSREARLPVTRGRRGGPLSGLPMKSEQHQVGQFRRPALAPVPQAGPSSHKRTLSDEGAPRVRDVDVILGRFRAWDSGVMSPNVV